MRIKINKLIPVLIVVFLVLMENCFYIVNADAMKISGVFNYNILWFIPYSLVVLIMLIDTLKTKKSTYFYNKEIILFVILCFVAAVMCKLLTGQPILRGLLPQRNFIVVYLSYYVIRYWLKKDMINLSVLERTFIWAGVISVILYLLQVSVLKEYQFIHVKTNIRYDSMRLYVDSVLCVYIAFIGLDNYFKTEKIRNLLLVVLSLLYELFVSKGRLEMSALILTVSFSVCVLSRLSASKIGLLVVGTIGIITFINTRYYDFILEGVSSYGSTSSTMNIRLVGRQLYLSQIIQSPWTLLFGCGYPSELYTRAAMRAGLFSKILLVDNGLYSILYVYGCLGLLLTVVWYVKMFRYSYRLFKTNGESRYLAFTIFQIILSYNIVFWWWHPSWTLTTILTMAIVEHKLVDLSNYDGVSLTRKG